LQQKFISIYNILSSVYGWQWLETPCWNGTQLRKESLRRWGREPDVVIFNGKFNQMSAVAYRSNRTVLNNTIM
jgi:hypothetical protein